MATDLSEDRHDRLTECERRIGYVFRDRQLLQSALTHASGANHRLASNERLEFLGDSILGAVVCDLLYRQFPDFLEGDLTKIKSVVVSRLTCARISAELRLDDFLIVGKGMSNGNSVPRSVLADVFESLVAAIYLDGVYDAAFRVIESFAQAEINHAANGDVDDNYKSLLQQMAQRDFGSTPTYQLLDERGPDHDKSFKITAFVGGKEFPPAWGRNKKEAEQRAACNALAALSGIDAPYVE